MSNSLIWCIARNLSGTTSPGQSGPRNDANKGAHCIPQSSSIIEASPSDPGHSLGEGFTPSAEMQSVYSATTADWAKKRLGLVSKYPTNIRGGEEIIKTKMQKKTS